jgi:hypothetical protein
MEDMIDRFVTWAQLRSDVRAGLQLPIYLRSLATLCAFSEVSFWSFFRRSSTIDTVCGALSLHHQQDHSDAPQKMETQLWRLASGAEFEDSNGQVFRKTGATATGPWFEGRTIKKHEVVCLASPFAEEPGPIVALHLNRDWKEAGGSCRHGLHPR